MHKKVPANTAPTADYITCSKTSVTPEWVAEQEESLYWVKDYLWHKETIDEAIAGGKDLIYIRVKHNVSQQVAKAQHKEKTKQTIQDIVPAEFLGFRFVFEKHASEQLPEQKKWDHAIDLVPVTETELNGGKEDSEDAFGLLQVYGNIGNQADFETDSVSAGSGSDSEHSDNSGDEKEYGNGWP
ncbi:hypothetical protein BC835DRAFT_1420508 [Cytidiella melzeri]|nr:hypothetical protein BC835DRAFT_1420508 [Cytidiella melzeri]